MPDIAMGRKEIMKALHVTNWRTIIRWKARSPGFRRIMRRNTITGRPFIVISEVRAWMVEFDRLKRGESE